MKKQLLFVSILGLLGASGAIIASSTNEVMKGAEAYNATTSLPTTIDLNDSTATEIRNYYSSLNGKSANELKGTNLLKNLKPILKNNQVYYSYDYKPDDTNTNGLAIWQMYEIIDRDWTKSPATALGSYGTYNSSTNKITNYQYGTNSNYKGNPYLHSLYVNRNVTNQTRAWGDHTQVGWGINREHIWAKSHGMNNKDDSYESAGARGDPMHLWSGNGYVNAYVETVGGSQVYHYHSNNFFGFVNKNESHALHAGDTYSYLTGNYEGYSASLGGSTIVFEPQDSDKGDIARAVFYMAARYNNFAGNDSDGIDANNPDLRLVDSVSDPNGKYGYDSSSSKTGNMGILRDLLAWNRLDPPDEWEIHRNNLLFKNYTNNRNPFVDFPEWAEYIWGSSTMDSNHGSVISYSSTPTGNANPTSDTINTFDASHDIPVTSVEVFPSAVTLEVGHSNMLSATVEPSNATNMALTWSSSNSGIVSVDGNVITAHVAGTAKIRATAHNGIYGECTVTVNGGSGGETVTQYELVTDRLYEGDEVVIAAQTDWNATTTNVLTKTVKSTYYLTPETGTVTNGVLNKTSSMPTWKVGVYGSSFTFHNNYDYLYGYISGSHRNIAATGTSSTAGNVWDVTKNSAQTGFDMKNVDNVYLEYYVHNTYGPEFTGYSSSNNSCPINFYRKVTKTIDIYTAEEFATDFLNSITCNNNGETAPTLSRSWSELATLYNTVDYNHKAVLVNAIADEDGTVVERAMARYDLLCRKYSEFNNFIGRSSANPSNSNPLSRIVRNNPLVIAFPICGGVIVIGIIVLIILRKKRII